MQKLYPLPDGSMLEMGRARFRAAEVLFRPDLIGEEWEGIHQCLYNSVEVRFTFICCVLGVRQTLFR